MSTLEDALRDLVAALGGAFISSWQSMSHWHKQLEAARAALAAHDAQPQEAQPVWIQPDHLQKARVAPFLCRVSPLQMHPDFVPLYAVAPGYRQAALDCAAAIDGCDTLNDAIDICRSIAERGESGNG